MPQPDWDLFSPPPEPPSGPQRDPRRYTGLAGSWRGYELWKATEEGRRAFAYIERAALDQAARGEARVSPRTLVAQVRERLKLEVNDHYSAWIADDLVARHPAALLSVIERRKRRRQKVA